LKIRIFTYLLIKSFQAVQKGSIYLVALADASGALASGTECKQDLDEVLQGELAVGDNKIREDGMGVPAAAHDTHDTDPGAMRHPLSEIQDVPPIIGMDMAISLAAAAWSDLLFRTEGCHEIFKP